MIDVRSRSITEEAQNRVCLCHEENRGLEVTRLTRHLTYKARYTIRLLRAAVDSIIKAEQCCAF